MKLKNIYHHIIKWFYLDWYKYVFEKPYNKTKVWCRLRGHPYNIIWYNSSGIEPDTRCSNCLDDLG